MESESAKCAWKKARNVNWTEREEVVLMESVVARESVLFGKFSGSDRGVKRKRECWQEITDIVNSISSTVRDVEGVKKKCGNIKQRAKSKYDEAKHTGTGGGPKGPSPTTAEDIYLNHNGDTPAVVGIPGGIDIASLGSGSGQLLPVTASIPQVCHTGRRGKQFSKDKIWEEMDRKYNLTKRKHAAVKKLKQINKVARTNLDCQLNSMKTTFAKRERQLVKEKRAIEEELTLIKVDRKLPPIPSQDPESDLPQDPESDMPQSPLAHSESDEFVIPELKCDECRFGISKKRCTNFPCFLPKTYTSIGYQMTSRSYSSLPNYQEMLGYSQGLRPPTRAKQPRVSSEQEQVVHKHRTPRVSVEDRERGLRQLVKELREKNMKNKPGVWAVNYGKPLPCRTILKPILLSSKEVV